MDWFRQFFIIPLSYLAAVCSIIFIAVEILTLTTWGLWLKGRNAAKTYWSVVSEPKKSSEIATNYVLAAIIAGLVLYSLTKNRGK